MTIYVDKLPEFCVNCICCSDYVETPWFFCRLKREIVEDQYTERPADCPLKELVQCNVPVVHGKWEILNEHTEYVYDDKMVHDLAGVKTWAVVARCNKCGFVHYFIEGHMCYCYCPQCGSRMDAERKEE